MSLLDPYAWPLVDAHAMTCTDSTRCRTCQQDDAPICEECLDDVPEGEGCRHDGHVWCGSCFVHRCAECRDDMRDSLREVRDL